MPRLDCSIQVASGLSGSASGDQVQGGVARGSIDAAHAADRHIMASDNSALVIATSNVTEPPALCECAARVS